MKQKFSKTLHEKFIKHFNIKETPNEIEKSFIKKTEKYVKYIKWIPWLKMVWIWNSISMNSATKESDIDLFIVTTPNSMWLNRIFITFIFQILWVRKSHKKHAWRFCLSFFATTDWLDFSDWKIDNDIYLYFWIVYFKPILDIDNTYRLFIEKNSNWADFSEYLPHPWIPSPLEEKEATKDTPPLLQRRGGWGVRGLNKILKKIFLPRTLKHYNSLWKPYWVIINDNMLKFHDWDIREKTKKELV